VGIIVGRGRKVGCAENNNIVYPFEHMFNAAISKNIEKCIHRAALDSSGHFQSFNSAMSNENRPVPRYSQVGLVPWHYGGIVIHPFNIKCGCLGSGRGMCNLATWIRDAQVT